MDLRVQAIQDYEEGASISALAEVYGVSRKTIYKWLARHAGEGVAGLADRSRMLRRTGSAATSSRTSSPRVGAGGGDRESCGSNWQPRIPISPGPLRAPSAKCGSAPVSRTAVSCGSARRLTPSRSHPSIPPTDLVRRLQRLVPHSRRHAL